jgi:hypothetical protein
MRRHRENAMKQRLVLGAFLGLLLLPGAQPANAAAGDTELNAADAKRAASCEANRIATIEVPERCGVHFIVQRLGGEESGFSMQYTAKPSQWQTDGSPTNAFWPPSDSGYHTYQPQTAEAFQPRPGGPFQVRVVGIWKWPGGDAPSTKAQLVDAKKRLFCMSRLNRVTGEDRVVLNFFAGANDPRPSGVVQVVFDGGSPSQKCRK